MNNQFGKKKNRFSAVIVTIVICVALVIGAVAISTFIPGGGFDLLPSAIKPGEVHFSDMKYERPDGKALIEDMDQLIDMIKTDKSFTDQSKIFTSINEGLGNFRTMSSLAEIYYYSDTTDEFYKNESDILNQEYVDIYDKICLLLDTIEASSFKVNYERSFFGVGYFNDWEPMTKSPAAIEMLKKEQALISDYQDSLSNAFVTYEGEDIYISSERFEKLAVEAQSEVIDLYYEKYSDLLGNIYAELVKIRLDIADEAGTDYVSYAYKSFDRDYSPKDANAYMDSITEHILPIVSNIRFDASVINAKTDTLKSFHTLSYAASKMGGKTSEAFDYMTKYGLFELSASENKVGLSFETFLEKYNSPFMFASSTGTAYDFSTYSHEFGHFVYDYANLGAGVTVDSTEIASQAMAYIMPLYSDGIGDICGDDMLKNNLYSTVDLYLSTCFINKFENSVYSLSKSEITLEKLTELAKNAAIEVGIDEVNADRLSTSWFEIQHIYISPMYYVSYAISNDVALQILEAELNDSGSGGVRAFEKLITKDHSLPLYESITKIGFESPFSEGRAEKIAALISRVFEGSTEETTAA